MLVGWGCERHDESCALLLYSYSAEKSMEVKLVSSDETPSGAGDDLVTSVV